MGVYDITGKMLINANVKDYGAKGDGITDDSAAIQSCLNAFSISGGTIYFPSGTYLLKTAVLFYSNQILWFDNNATLLQGASINNLLRAYSDLAYTEYNGVHDCHIYGGTFDGGEYTENNTLVGISHAKNIIFENCIFKNAYGSWHNLEINSSYNIKVINCDFEGSRKTHENGEMLQIDGADNSGFYPWPDVTFDGTVSKYIDICGCIFHDDEYSPAIGNHSNMVHKFLRVHDCIFDGISSSRGALNFVSSMSNIDIHDNTFSNCAKGIGSFGATYYIHDNRFVDVTSPISGSSTSVTHANMINGTYTA